MLSIICKEFDPAGCDFKAVGKTKEDVAQKLLEHAQQSHAEMIQDPTPDKMDALQLLVMSKVRET